MAKVKFNGNCIHTFKTLNMAQKYSFNVCLFNENKTHALCSQYPFTNTWNSFQYSQNLFACVRMLAGVFVHGYVCVSGVMNFTNYKQHGKLTDEVLVPHNKFELACHNIKRLLVFFHALSISFDYQSKMCYLRL